MITVVVLSKYPEIFEGFRASVERDAPHLEKIVVWDCMNLPEIEGWYSIAGSRPFKIARNANIGWLWVNTDILYCGDDVRFIEPDTIKRLSDVAYADPKIGIVAARIQGLTPSQPFVPFVCVFIKRAVIDRVGYLDERFEGYGCEDASYCVDATLAGFKVGFANNVTVQHQMMTTFLRAHTQEQLMQQDAENWKRFADKYGLPNDRKKIWNWMRDCGKARGICPL